MKSYVHIHSAKAAWQFGSQIKSALIHDSLMRNTAFLVASTAIMSVLGFGFWIFVARLYSPAQVGAASTLIAVTTLVSTISILGFNTGLIRFLPESKNQSRDINAAMLLISLVSIVATVAYYAISAALHAQAPLLNGILSQAAFALLMAGVSLNTLTDAVFIANRKAQYHTVAYTIFSVVRLILPLVLVWLGSLGIFMAYAGATLAALALRLLLMKRSCGYMFTATPNWKLLSKVKTYAANNYIGLMLASLPSQIMPLIIIKDQGAAAVAFFSMAWTMVGLLYIVPTAATQSLLAESAHDPLQKTQNIKSTVKLLSLIIIPMVVISVVVAPYLLHIFGPEYSVGSTPIFQIFAISTIFITINTVCNTILNIEHRTSGIVISQIGGLLATIVSTYFLLDHGLVGIGIAMLLGSVASNLCHAVIFAYIRRHRRTAISPLEPLEQVPPVLN
jgi:O-antigen/teichoic acid export membrane protein